MTARYVRWVKTSKKFYPTEPDNDERNVTHATRACWESWNSGLIVRLLDEVHQITQAQKEMAQ